MDDLLYIAITLAFFGLAIALQYYFEKI